MEVESMPVVQKDGGLPEIAPIEVDKKEYMTEKRKVAIAKARKARSQKIAVRNANKGRAVRALKGIKSMFESLKKRQCTCGATPEVVSAPAPVKPAQARGNRMPPLLGGPKVTF